MGIAYIVSLVFYGIGRLVLLHTGITVGVLAVAVVAAICVAVLVSHIRGKRSCPYCTGGCGSCRKKK